MRWLRMLFKKTYKVYVPVDEQGQIIQSNGLVAYKYRRSDPQFFNAKPSNLEYLPGELPSTSQDEPSPTKPKAKKLKSPPPPQEPQNVALPQIAPGQLPPPNTIVVYTDGGASPNPGPTGAAFVMVYGSHVLEYWEYLGSATNNVGELTAILRALQHIKKRELKIVLHSDSSYAIGVSSNTMKAKQNLELVNSIKELIAQCPLLTLHKVKAHVGIALNEHVDALVGLARVGQSSGQRRSVIQAESCAESG